MNSARIFAISGSLFAMISVAAGAFGAHALRAKLEPRLLDVFETGARYQMYHALGLFAVAWAVGKYMTPQVTVAGWLMVIGVVIFSGSLYLLALTGANWLGAITPFGGVALIAAWALLAWGIFVGNDAGLP